MLLGFQTRIGRLRRSRGAACHRIDRLTPHCYRTATALLPHCYRDSETGFYLWRNRWQDDDDTVITVLTTRTAGYMKSSSDRALKLNSMGRHFSWGTIKDGPTRHWSTTPRGQTSSLTLSDGSCFGVDFMHMSCDLPKPKPAALRKLLADLEAAFRRDL